MPIFIFPKTFQYNTSAVDAIKAAIIVCSIYMIYDFGLGMPNTFEKVFFFIGVLIMDFIVALLRAYPKSIWITI